MKTCPKRGGYFGPEGKCICVPQPETQAFAPPEIRSSDGLDALAENYARQAEVIFDDPRLTREGKIIGVTMLFLETWHLSKSASRP
jgi:hypothetical protein